MYAYYSPPPPRLWNYESENTLWFIAHQKHENLIFLGGIPNNKPSELRVWSLVAASRVLSVALTEVVSAVRELKIEGKRRTPLVVDERTVADALVKVVLAGGHTERVVLGVAERAADLGVVVGVNLLVGSGEAIAEVLVVLADKVTPSGAALDALLENNEVAVLALGGKSSTEGNEPKGTGVGLNPVVDELDVVGDHTRYGIKDRANLSGEALGAILKASSFLEDLRAVPGAGGRARSTASGIANENILGGPDVGRSRAEESATDGGVSPVADGVNVAGASDEVLSGKLAGDAKDNLGPHGGTKEWVVNVVKVAIGALGLAKVALGVEHAAVGRRDAIHDAIEDVLVGVEAARVLELDSGASLKIAVGVAGAGIAAAAGALVMRRVIMVVGKGAN